MSEAFVPPQLHFELPVAATEQLPAFDKSWMIRLGLLDALAGSNRMVVFLENAQQQGVEIGQDLEALARVTQQWQQGEPLDVGESGTIYRFFRFAAWQEEHQYPEKPQRIFIASGSLADRAITNNPEIIFWPIEDLLKLDGKTTQWASAAVLLRDEKNAELYDDEAKYLLSIEAKQHWHAARLKGKSWEPRKDDTIGKQAAAYFQALRTAQCVFTPQQAEDYCFARAYGLISKEEGEVMWPKLRHHESDRIESMERALQQAVNREVIDVNDHRVVQAIAMRFGLPKSRFKYPNCVAKSWPTFWEFRRAAQEATSGYIASF